MVGTGHCSETRRIKLDKHVSGMSKVSEELGHDVRLLMAKRVVTAAMRRLVSPKPAANS